MIYLRLTKTKTNLIYFIEHGLFCGYFDHLGVVCTMIGAMILHMKQIEGTNAVVINLVIMAIGIFVAYGRFIF